jgi:hypothetical protein
MSSVQLERPFEVQIVAGKPEGVCARDGTVGRSQVEVSDAI